MKHLILSTIVEHRQQAFLCNPVFFKVKKKESKQNGSRNSMSFTWDGNLNLGFGAPPKSTSPSSVVVSSTTRPNVKSGSNRRAQSKRHTTKQKTHSEIFVEDFDFGLYSRLAFVMFTN